MYQQNQPPMFSQQPYYIRPQQDPYQGQQYGQPMMSPFAMSSLLNKGGGAAAGTAGATGGAGAGAGVSGGAGVGATGGAASSAGGGFGSMMSSAGPWAALAAVIAANEYNAQKGGYRSEDDTQYAKDVFGGKVLEQDINQRWVPKFFGEDKYGFGGDAKVAGELSTFDFSNAWDTFKNEGMLAKLLSKAF